MQTWTYDNGVTATEECDWWDGCNSSCKKETTPTTTIEAECNSDYIGEQYNEKHPTPILNKYMSLCASWNTMSNFELDTTTWTYTWNCNWTNAGTMFVFHIWLSLVLTKNRLVFI